MLRQPVLPSLRTHELRTKAVDLDKLRLWRVLCLRVVGLNINDGARLRVTWMILW